MTAPSKIASAAEYYFGLASERFNREIEVNNTKWVNVQPNRDFPKMPHLEKAISEIFSQFHPEKNGIILVIFNQDNGSYTSFRVLIQVGSGYFLASMRLDDEKVVIVDIEDSTKPHSDERYTFKQGKWNLDSYSDKY